MNTEKTTLLMSSNMRVSSKKYFVEYFYWFKAFERIMIPINHLSGYYIFLTRILFLAGSSNLSQQT